MARASRFPFVLALAPILAGCGASTGLHVPHDGGAADRSADAPDADESHSSFDGGTGGRSDAPGSNDSGRGSVDGPSETSEIDGGGAGGDAAVCETLSLRLAWILVAPGGGGPRTCDEAGAKTLRVDVDDVFYDFPCAAGAATVLGLAPGVHKVVLELHGSGVFQSGARNPTSCVNDIDCVATPACGGEVCSYYSGAPSCQPAGQQPTGTDGWCTTDTDCKCFAQGAKCIGVFCTFTRQQSDVELFSLALPDRDFGCGLADLGTVSLYL
jgi:hypothetical protein